MGRKRFVSPEFFTHVGLFEAELDSGLPQRLPFEGLWCQADRRGIFRWQPRQLKLACMPYDDVDFAAIVDSLESHGFVKSYVVDDKRYGIIPSFGNWQHFHQKELASNNPAPPTKLRASRMHDSSNGDAPTVHDASISDAPRVNPPVAVTVTTTTTDAITTSTKEKETGKEKETATQPHRERAREAAPLRSASSGASSLAAIPFKPPPSPHDPELAGDILGRMPWDTEFKQ